MISRCRSITKASPRGASGVSYLSEAYLMAAANAADPKTERKTEAERPAVSLGRVGPSRAG